MAENELQALVGLGARCNEDVEETDVTEDEDRIGEDDESMILG